MTTTNEQPNRPVEKTSPKTVDKAQYLVCAVLVAVGGFLIYDALSLEAGFAKVDPVGPRMFPIAVGVGLIVLAIILASRFRAARPVRRRAARTSTRARRPTGAPWDCSSGCSWR